jgi:hypothetical protein
MLCSPVGCSPESLNFTLFMDDVWDGKEAAEERTFGRGRQDKSYIGEKGMMSSSDAVEAIHGHVYRMQDAAVDRAKASRRSTAGPQDL